jgi:predicted XRE-type DNA-binding protein
VTTRTKSGLTRHLAGSTNVYADLGYPDAGDMLVKAQLVTMIGEILAERGSTQSEAAVLLGISQPKLSRILRGQFRGISERKLMDCLARLGRDLEIVVRVAPKNRVCGSVSVVLA